MRKYISERCSTEESEKNWRRDYVSTTTLTCRTSSVDCRLRTKWKKVRKNKRQKKENQRTRKRSSASNLVKLPEGHLSRVLQINHLSGSTDGWTRYFIQHVIQHNLRLFKKKSNCFQWLCVIMFMSQQYSCFLQSLRTTWQKTSHRWLLAIA